MNEDLAWLDIVTRLAAAMACGMVLGFERASKNKPAGLRTHMLVCLASACFTILATEIFFSQLEVTKGETAVDTTRVIEGVIAGVAFSAPARSSKAAAMSSASRRVPASGSPAHWVSRAAAPSTSLPSPRWASRS